jgi:acyl-CoA synthetase (AMP-forming)/AMP-acid ligase II/enoyl-CoA hydratase/carnithine racemase
MRQDLKTTRPVRPVRTIDDVIAIEAHPYDELVTARNLYDLFLATAQHVGDHKALTVLRSENPDDVGVSLTHRGLLKAVTQSANLFHGLGISPGRGVVAFLAPTLPQLPGLLLGAQVAGTASTINYLLTREAIVDLLNAQQAAVLVIPAKALDDTCWSKAEGILEHVPSLRHVLVIGPESDEEPAGAPGYRNVDAALDGCREDALDFAPTSDRNTVCALFHTGGTTGRPKVVQLTHGNQIHAAFGFAQVFGYDENDTVINGFPFFHVGGTITVGLSVLAAGGHIVVPGPYGLRPPAVIAGHWRIVQRFGATVVGGVPTSIAALTNTWDPATDAKRIRMAATGGAVCPKAVSSRFEAVTGIRLFETYGMTETAAAIAFNPGRGTPVAGSVGFRAPYSQTRIVALDPGNPGQSGRLCGPNESGLVQVRGPQVFPGYLDPAHNAGTLAADGWLTTGDVGYLTEDARLVLTGREKDLIIRSGHNIDPATIEDVANRFDGVEISAAVGMPDQYAGEVPALFVVPKPGSQLDVGAVARYVEANIHEPPARPRTVLVLDALPVTAVGKIFKPALRDLAIKEKVRQEAAAVCGPAANVEIDVRMGDRKQTLVDVTVSGADAAQLEQLAEALKSLPQTYTFKTAAPATVRANPADPVTLEVQDGIATLTLNRPDKLNAASREMMRSLQAQVQAVARLAGVRVVIIAGSGRAFSAGGDLIEFGAALEADPARLLADLRFNQDVFGQIEALPVPVIGAANGLAVAGGLELLLTCDIILAAEGARMGDGHARYGVVPAGGATVRLRERISPSHAAQLFYTADMVDAETMRAWGLVNEVLPAEKLMPRAQELARQICRCSPEAVRAIKSLTAPSPERNRRLEDELVRFAEHVRGNDLAKGLAAFREKRSVPY